MGILDKRTTPEPTAAYMTGRKARLEGREAGDLPWGTPIVGNVCDLQDWILGWSDENISLRSVVETQSATWLFPVKHNASISKDAVVAINKTTGMAEIYNSYNPELVIIGTAVDAVVGDTTSIPHASVEIRK